LLKSWFNCYKPFESEWNRDRTAQITEYYAVSFNCSTIGFENIGKNVLCLIEFLDCKKCRQKNQCKVMCHMQYLAFYMHIYCTFHGLLRQLNWFLQVNTYSQRYVFINENFHFSI
jgi:hypothetical protein